LHLDLVAKHVGSQSANLRTHKALQVPQFTFRTESVSLRSHGVQLIFLAVLHLMIVASDAELTELLFVFATFIYLSGNGQRLPLPFRSSL
jgi:hypothetical protein